MPVTGTPIVVVVPGITGSELLSSKDGSVIWPATCPEYIFGYPDAKFQRLMGALNVGDIIRSVGPVVVYKALIDFLNSIGYTENPRHGNPNLYVFPYDWRQDCRQTAGLLAQKVSAIANSYRPAPVAVSIVAHSMGCLISRYMLESGAFSGEAGLPSVAQLIMLAGPNLGAPKALATIRGQEASDPLTIAQTQQLSNLPQYPTAYQLLPFASAPALWHSNVPLLPADLYDPQVAAALGLLANSLQAAQGLQSGLDLGRAPKGVRYFAFTGTQYSTESYNSFTPPGQSSAVSEPYSGDGTVPIWSACPPSIQGQFVGQSHAYIFKDADLQDTLAKLLPPLQNLPQMRATTIAGGPPSVNVSTRDPTVISGDIIHLNLRIDSRIEKLEGNIVVERSPMETPEMAASPEPRFQPFQTLGIQLPGRPPKYLGLQLEAITQLGAYRVSFVSTAGQTGGEPAVFVVLQRRP